MTAEAGLRARILAAIRQTWPRRTGVSLWGRPASAASGPGHPDIGGVVRSRPIALEIKKARGKPTPLQEQRIRDLRDCGAYAWIVRSPAEALQAVYWTAKGWTRPMSNEPIDLNAWLNTSPAQAPAPEFAPAAEAVPDDPFEAPVLPEPAAFNFEPLSSPYTEEHHHAVEVVMGADKRNYPVIENQERAEAAEHRRSIQEQADADQSLAYAVEVIKTLGDRVTMVWERLGEYNAVLHAVVERQDILLAHIDDLYNLINDEVSPGDDGTVSLEVIANGTIERAEPMTLRSADDPAVAAVARAEAPKRKRRSRAEMEAARAAQAPEPGPLVIIDSADETSQTSS